MEYKYTDELYHYGRKGMKWGQHIFGKIKTVRVNRQRKKNLEKARVAKAEKAKAAAQRKKDLDSGKISAKKMTREELTDRINRLEMEKKYKNLVAETSASGRAKKFVANVLERSSENIATQLATYALGAGVNKVAKDVLGLKNATEKVKVKNADGIEIEEIREIFEDIVNPRKGQKDK